MTNELTPPQRRVTRPLDFDDDIDLLPDFCPHTEKVLLTAPWANGLTHIVRTSKHLRVGSELVADIVSSCVCARPLTRLTNVMLDLKDDYRLDITYRLAWLGVEKARGERFGTHSISFD
ncbi:hypothetical protein ACSBR1_014954 [Camellia fascicularis]